MMLGFEDPDMFHDQYVTKPMAPSVLPTIKINADPWPRTGGPLISLDAAKPTPVSHMEIHDGGSYKPNDFKALPEEHSFEGDNEKKQDIIKIAGFTALAIALTYAIWRR